MIEACMPFDSIERYATGVAEEDERLAVERHAAVCEDCRLTLAATGLAFRPGDAAEEALVARIAADRPIPVLLSDLGISAGGAATRRAQDRWFGRFHKAVAAAGVAAAACLALVLAVPGGSDAPLPHRVLEGRPAALAVHVPVLSARGGGQAGWEAREANLAEGVAARGEVAFLLARGAPGDWDRAGVLIERAAPTADRENDRGVLLLARGDAPEALASFDRALELDGGHAAARFNRALALEALGRKAEARTAWERYLEVAAGDAAGWREEAKARLGN